MEGVEDLGPEGAIAKYGRTSAAQKTLANTVLRMCRRLNSARKPSCPASVRSSSSAATSISMPYFVMSSSASSRRPLLSSQRADSGMPPRSATHTTAITALLARDQRQPPWTSANSAPTTVASA